MRHRLLLVTLFLLWASKLCFANYELVGTLYPLRWGQQEGSADLVNPPNRLGQPLCVKMGSTFGCRLVETGGGVIGWKVSSARLISRTSGQVYWSVTDSGVGNLIPPSATYWLPNIPSWVDYARLEMSFVILYWGPWGPTYYLTPIYSSEEVFIVLDEPKAPMNPAWVSVLRKSCVWARQTNNLYDTGRAITFGVFFQRPGFAYPDDTATYWLIPPSYTVFRLRALLDAWESGSWTSGNCNDVSCFTMLAFNSIGLDFSVRRLSQTAYGSFITNPLCKIGSDPTLDQTYSSWEWMWHQICVPSGDPDPPSNQARIWDPTAAQKEDLNGNGYRNPPAHHPDNLWPQKDYWQKPHTQIPGAWLGLVNFPVPSEPQLSGPGTWKCGVTTQ